MEEFEILKKRQIKKMKRVFILGLLLWLGTSLYAQTTEQERNAIISERKAVSKMTEKAIEARVTKTAKKEAKRLQKQGWQPGPGTLPIQKQLDNSYRKRVEMEGTTPKYIMGSSTNVGGNYTAAKKAAMEFARQDVANQISSEMRELIEASVNNQELSNGEAESLTKVVSASVTKVSQTLGSLPIVFEVYREKDAQKEVMLNVAYESRLAKRDLLKALENETESLRQKLEILLKEW